MRADALKPGDRVVLPFTAPCSPGGRPLLDGPTVTVTSTRPARGGRTRVAGHRVGGEPVWFDAVDVVPAPRKWRKRRR